ncbi:MAG: ATP-binding cassette domain-containing protein [Pseudomonadota bacterium]
MFDQVPGTGEGIPHSEVGAGAPDGSIRLESVCFSAAGRTLLKDVTLTLDSGPPTVVLGPNGAGKSLLLKIVAGLLTPSSGAVRLEAGDQSSPFDLSDIAIVLQRPILLRRSVRENLNHAVRAAGAPKRDRSQMIANLLARGGLSHLAEQPARKLSGGEQQRLSLVRALAARPRVLLLDEPTASLDPHSTAMIEALLREAAGEGVHVVLVTHDLAQARRVAGRVVFVHAGQIAEHRQAQAFFDAPQSRAGQAYLDGKILLDDRGGVEA